MSIVGRMLKSILNPGRSSALIPPEVPAQLRELLKDYPPCVESLQEVLNEFADPTPRVQPLDEAIWALQNRLDRFLQQAVRQFEAARADGNLLQMDEAERARSTMGRALLSFDSDPEGLGRYFKLHKKAFE
ncbi:MAG: hypothetical protein ACREP7_07895 [Lysobacter sp.]